jgi:hypothetical protein
MENRGIALKVLTQNIDTGTPEGRLFFHMTAAFDEFQRELIVENTKAGLAAANKRGRRGGRPRALDDKKSKNCLGSYIALTPAYDICPQGRAGNEASQAMLINGNNRQSRLAVCISAAAQFHLSEAEAITLIEQQIVVIQNYWSLICDEAGLTKVDRNLMWQRQFMNPYAFEGAPDRLRKIVA